MFAATTVRRLVATTLLLALCLLLPACGGKSKVSQANYDKLKKDMTLADVEAILGKGTKDDSGDASNVAAQFAVAVPGVQTTKRPDTYVWEKSDKKILVCISEGKVVHMEKSGF